MSKSLKARIQALELGLSEALDALGVYEPGSPRLDRLRLLLAGVDSGPQQLVLSGDPGLPALIQPGALSLIEPEQPRPQAFIGAYVSAYQKRYGHRPELDGKSVKQMAIWANQYPAGIARACELIQVYVQMDDPWFTTKHHDFQTFVVNLNKVAHARETGSEETNAVNWNKVFKP